MPADAADQVRLHALPVPRLGHRIAVLGVEPATELDRARLLRGVEPGPDLLAQRQHVRIAALGGEVEPGVGGGRVGGRALAVEMHHPERELRGLVGEARGHAEIIERAAIAALRVRLEAALAEHLVEVAGARGRQRARLPRRGLAGAAGHGRAGQDRQAQPDQDPADAA